MMSTGIMINQITIHLSEIVVVVVNNDDDDDDNTMQFNKIAII